MQLMLVPGRSKRSSPPSQIAHPSPRQEGGPSKVSIKIFLGQAKLYPNSSPYFFLPGKCQRKIYSVESHPVDVFLPVLPGPPDKAIPWSANILVVSVEIVG